MKTPPWHHFFSIKTTLMDSSRKASFKKFLTYKPHHQNIFNGLPLLQYFLNQKKKKVMTCTYCYKSTQEKKAMMWRGKGQDFGAGNGDQGRVPHRCVGCKRNENHISLSRQRWNLRLVTTSCQNRDSFREENREMREPVIKPTIVFKIFQDFVSMCAC